VMLLGTDSRHVRLASVAVLSAVILPGLVPWRLMAAEPKVAEKPQPSVAKKAAPGPVRYVAEVKFSKAAQKGRQIREIRSKATGVEGIPLEMELSGINGYIVKAKFEEAAKYPEYRDGCHWVVTVSLVEKQGNQESEVVPPTTNGTVERGGCGRGEVMIEYTVTKIPPEGQKK
jgi:hypothetical protein